MALISFLLQESRTKRCQERRVRSKSYGSRKKEEKTRSHGGEIQHSSKKSRTYPRSVVMHAHGDGNPSESEKDNRLLFGEQWMLLFSKSKMVEVFQPIRSRIRAGAHDSVESGWPVFQHGRVFVGTANLNS